MEPGEIAKDAAVEAAILPVLDGLHKMSDEIVKTRKSSDEKTTELAKTFERKVEDLEAKTNKSLEDIVGRIGRLKDHTSIIGRAMLDIGPGEDSLREVVSKNFKDRAGAFEALARSQPKASSLSDPLTAMAVTEWFQRSTRTQMQRFMSSIQEDSAQAGRLFAALQEKHFGSNWEAVTKAAYQEDTAAEGGNMVPTIVEADFVRQIKDAGKLFPLARQVQMTKKVHDMPSETTAVTVNWVAEEGALTQGEGNIGKKTLTALKIAGRAKMSIELVEDSNVGLLAYLLEVFTEKIAGELDKQAVLGDGSQPLITGIDNTSGIIVVSSSATAAGRNLTWQLLVNTYVGSGEGSAIENGVWIVSPKGYAAIMGLADSAGMPVIKFSTTEVAPAGTLLGRPIILSARFGGAPAGVTATLDDTTNANTKIIYGVPRSLLFGTRQGMRWDVTDQVGWANYQMDARLVGRFASIVGVPANFSRLSKVNT
jgi:HK97 family phage major capsid protein